MSSGSSGFPPPEPFGHGPSGGGQASGGQDAGGSFPGNPGNPGNNDGLEFWRHHSQELSRQPYSNSLYQHNNQQAQQHPNLAQQAPYQGLGTFQRWQRPAPQQSRLFGWLLGGAVTFGLVVVVLAGVLVAHYGQQAPIAAPTNPTEQPGYAPRVCARASAPTPVNAQTRVDQQQFIPPVHGGWYGVAWPALRLAYDVPPHWQPRAGMWKGLSELPGENRQLIGYSNAIDSCCGPDQSSARGVAGLATSPELDPVRAGTETVETWARLSFSTRDAPAIPPRTQLEAPRPVLLSGGTKAGTLITAHVTPAKPTSCGATSAQVTAAVLSTPEGSVLVVSMSEQGIAEATPPPDLEAMATSLRTLP